VPRPRLKPLMQPAFAAIRLDKGFHLQPVVRTRRARELRLRGLSIRRDVGPKDRTCGIDQRASQLHWRCAGDQKSANRLSPTRSCLKAASGHKPQTNRVGYVGPYPSADEDGCDDQQSERQVGPDEHVEREPMRPAPTRPNTVDSRMLKSQRSTEIATSAMPWD
jgi:hypothetical protein